MGLNTTQSSVGLAPPESRADWQVLALLDEDWDIPCEVTVLEVRCGQPAAWIVWPSCCLGRVVMMCRDCYSEVASATGAAFECDVCGEISNPARRFISYSEPLNKGKP